MYDPNKKNVFIFTFLIEIDEETSKEITYTLELFDSISYIEDTTFKDDFYENVVEPLESLYGVHDVSISYDSEYGNELIGYTTYEVEEDNISSLLANWLLKLDEIGLYHDENWVKVDEKLIKD